MQQIVRLLPEHATVLHSNVMLTNGNAAASQVLTVMMLSSFGKLRLLLDVPLNSNADSPAFRQIHVDSDDPAPPLLFPRELLSA